MLKMIVESSSYSCWKALDKILSFKVDLSIGLQTKALIDHFAKIPCLKSILLFG